MIKSNSPDIVFINKVKNITGAHGGAVDLGTGLKAGRSRVRLWPPHMHAAILWILAHLVHYRLQTHRSLSLRKYMDFLQRSCWKAYQQVRTRPKQGRYLDVLDSTYLWCSGGTWLPPTRLRGKMLYLPPFPQAIDALNTK